MKGTPQLRNAPKDRQVTAAREHIEAMLIPQIGIEDVEPAGKLRAQTAFACFCFLSVYKPSATRQDVCLFRTSGNQHVCTVESTALQDHMQMVSLASPGAASTAEGIPGTPEPDRATNPPMTLMFAPPKIQQARPRRAKAPQSPKHPLPSRAQGRQGRQQPAAPPTRQCQINPPQDFSKSFLVNEAC